MLVKFIISSIHAFYDWYVHSVDMMQF